MAAHTAVLVATPSVGLTGTGERRAGGRAAPPPNAPRRVRDRPRVDAGEAGEAEPVPRQLQRVEHAPDGQVGERIGAQVVADALEVHAGRDQLRLDLRVA